MTIVSRGKRKIKKSMMKMIDETAERGRDKLLMQVEEGQKNALQLISMI